MTPVKRPIPPSIVDVTQYGAKGNGTTDDTAAIQKAIAAAGDGSVLFLPRGNYPVSDELLITRRISVLGVGLGSQIFQTTTGKNLFHLNNTSGVSVRDLYLGSASTLAGTSLLRLNNSHHTRVDNIIMLGGYYGLHLAGSLLGTFTGLKTGTNFGGFFRTTPVNQYWVYAERLNNISANANTFVGLALEGGTNGLYLQDPSGEGSVVINGGTIEGVANQALTLQGTGLPSLISGLHMEANGTGDILLSAAHRTRIESVVATKKIEIAGVSTNTTISDSLVEKIVIGPNAARTQLYSLAMNLTGTSVPFVDNQASDTQFTSVTDINPFDWFGTVGIGANNPNSNPVGLTPDLKLQVAGHIKAQAFDTGDIHFWKNGRPLWRMYEDEKGLYLENAASGVSSRVFLESDITELKDKLQSQQNLLGELRVEVQRIKDSAPER